MNFFDGGWMLLVVVGLWFLVYLPNLGNKNSVESKGSTKSRKSAISRSNISKKPSNGVSKLVIRNKNFRLIRIIFAAVFVASLAGIVYGIIGAFSDLMSLTTSAIALASLLVSVSVLRSTGAQKRQKSGLSAAEMEAQRRRMAYLIRESALIDAKPDELFDERAWSDTALPESLLNRQVGIIDTSKLAEVVSFEEIKSVASEKKLASEELNLILKRRRANN
ncbi:MAG: hypothetical protein RLZZ471_766 [Actinomycetota bacterium]|jgi:hypothetical protein